MGLNEFIAATSKPQELDPAGFAAFQNAGNVIDDPAEVTSFEDKGKEPVIDDPMGFAAFQDNVTQKIPEPDLAPLEFDLQTVDASLADPSTPSDSVLNPEMDIMDKTTSLGANALKEGLKGLGRGVTGMAGAGTLLTGMALDSVGQKDLAEKVFTAGLEVEDLAGTPALEAEVASVKNAFESPESFVQWASGALGSQLPLLASSGLGGAVGKKVGTKIGGKIGASVDNLKKLQLAGAITGAGATAGVIETGGTFSDIIRATGSTEHKTEALVAGGISAALEIITPLKWLNKLGFGKKIKDEVIDIAKKSPLWASIKGIVTDATTESITEGAQTAVNLAAVFTADESRKIFEGKGFALSEEFKKEFIENAIEAMSTGALVGGSLGGVTSYKQAVDQNVTVDLIIQEILNGTTSEPQSSDRAPDAEGLEGVGTGETIEGTTQSEGLDQQPKTSEVIDELEPETVSTESTKSEDAQSTAEGKTEASEKVPPVAEGAVEDSERTAVTEAQSVSAQAEPVASQDFQAESVTAGAEVAPDSVTQVTPEGKGVPQTAEVDTKRTTRDPSNTEKFFALNRKLSPEIPTDAEVAAYDELSDSEKNRAKVRFESIGIQQNTHIKGLLEKRKLAQKALDRSKGKSLKKAQEKLDKIDRDILDFTETSNINVGELIANSEFGKTITTELPRVVANLEASSIDTDTKSKISNLRASLETSSTQDTETVAFNQTKRGKRRLGVRQKGKLESTESNTADVKVPETKADPRKPKKKSESKDDPRKPKPKTKKSESTETKTDPRKPKPAEKKSDTKTKKDDTGSDGVDKGLLPTGDGDQKSSRLADRIVNDLGNLPEEQQKDVPQYNQVSKKENILAAVNYVAKDPQAAFDAYVGREGTSLPSELLRGSVGIALGRHARDAGDSISESLLLDIASLMGTRAGQEVSILSEADDADPLQYIEYVNRRRSESKKDKEGHAKKKSKMKKDTKKDLADIAKKTAPKKGEWITFVESLKKCQ